MGNTLPKATLLRVGAGALLVFSFLGVLYFLHTRNITHRQILIVLKTLENPYFQDMSRGIEQAAKTFPDYRIIVEPKEPEAFKTEADVDRQVTTIRRFLEKKQIAAVSIAPASSSSPALSQLVSDLNQEKVHVIILDTRILQDGSIDAFIGSDNETGGQLAAEFIGQKIGNNTVTILFLEGRPDYETARARRNGFMKVYHTEYQNWNIIEQTADWNREKAEELTDTVLDNDDVGVPAAIFGSNDEMALGAINALRSRGVSATNGQL